MRVGTLSPSARASLSPMATACLRLITLRPERPDLSLPAFISRIARSTFLPDLRLYLRPLAFFRVVFFRPEAFFRPGVFFRLEVFFRLVVLFRAVGFARATPLREAAFLRAVFFLRAGIAG